MINIKLKFRLFFLGVLVTGIAGAQENKKSISKSYDVGARTGLSIENKFGDIHVDTWGKPVIQVDVEVIVNARSERKSQEILNRIQVDIDESDTEISFETELDALRTKENENFEVNYEVMMPSENPLVLENSFGDTYVDNRKGRTELDVSYGSLKAGDLTDVELDLAFAKGSIGQLANGDFEVKYSEFIVDVAEDLILEQQFSDLELGKVGTIRLKSKYGAVELGEAGRVQVEVDYSKFSIKRLMTYLDMDASYVSGFEIARLSKDFKLVNISGRYGSYQINIEQGTQAHFEGEFRYSSLKDQDDIVDLYYRIADNNRKTFKGKIGDGNPDQKIKVTSSYGDLRLYYN
ncbi:MAG: hypothetical protein KI790_05380 [Cyclobacteriaceae bacterium]|nr:hypothetical protein [Cyclobacteriaceae bacterium HetDA_MAG_MS6]